MCGSFFSEDVSLRAHIDTHSKKELYQCILSLKQVLIQSGISTKSNVIEDHHLNDTDGDGITVISDTTTPNHDKTEEHDQSSEKVIAIKQEHFEDISLYSGIQRMENEDDISLQQTLTNDPDVVTEVNETEQEKWTENDSPAVTTVESNETEAASVVPSADNLTCEICNKKLTTWYTLKRHMMSHNSKKQEFCPFCGKGFLGTYKIFEIQRLIFEIL